MENIERVEEPISNFDEVITRLVSDHVKYHTIHFFKKTKVDTFVPVCTRVLVHLYGVFCVFTTGHVREFIDDFNYLYFQCDPNKYITCEETSRDSDDKVKTNPDIVYLKLAHDVVEQLLAFGQQFLPLDKILLYHTGYQTNQYAILGYPPELEEQVEENILPNGFLFSCAMADVQPYDPFIYKKDTHYILPYSNPINISGGTSAKRQVYDLRCSGLWYISVTEQKDKCEYDYYFIGITKEYYQHKRSQHIVANKIQSLIAQLQEDLSYE
ncbi:MAG: hypothetical protein KA536_10335 [Saprospiraceae bacterium]|nr:hypothetical protein [Saprospiraceae bacterium]